MNLVINDNFTKQLLGKLHGHFPIIPWKNSILTSRRNALSKSKHEYLLD